MIKKLATAMLLVSFVFSINAQETNLTKKLFSMNELAKKDLTKASWLAGIGVGLEFSSIPFVYSGASFRDDNAILKMIAGGALMMLGVTVGLVGVYRVSDATKTIQTTQYLLDRPNTSPESVEAILNHKVYIGMPYEDLIASVGNPMRTNSSVNASGVYSQLVYYFGYVYVDKFSVTSIQYTQTF